MHTRGRYSAANLSIVSPDGPREPPPEPPAYFNEREAVEWRAIVECLPQGFFPYESLALLTSYVSIAVQLDAINGQLSKFKGSLPPRDATRKEYWELTRARGPLVMQLAVLSAKLRIAPSARNDRTTRRAGQSGSGAKPWEFGTVS
jgi:hypothetical protein